MRKKVFERDGYRCAVCGKESPSGNGLSIDHIVPLFAGGTSTLDNLQTLCVSCNAMKGAKVLPYNTCPDCGQKVYYWNDGGNGFCSNCAPESLVRSKTSSLREQQGYIPCCSLRKEIYGTLFH